MKKLLNILILEDLKYDYELVKQELTKTDLAFKTFHATDRESFEKAMLNFNPDLILSDFSLPQYDGMEALKHVLSLNKNIPFIIVTGSINEEIAVDCIKAGAYDYVTKEHLSRLGPAINGALQKNKAFTEKRKAERMQNVLFNITKAAEESESIEGLSKKIHKELGEIVDNTNFYISLYHPEIDKYSFPFFTDISEEPDLTEYESLSNSFTDYVRRTGKALLVDSKKVREMGRLENIHFVGKVPKIWAGAPLIDSNTKQIIGITAIQNYDNPQAFDNNDLELLAFIARNIGSVMARTKAKLALQESEEQFRNITETATDGIIMINKKGNIKIWNKAAESIFGFTEKEAINKKLHELVMPSSYKKKNELGLKEFFKSGKGKIIGKTIEVKGKHKNGNLIPLELSVSRIKKNNSWHATGIVRDITERKVAENELRIAKEKAEESDRLKTSFLANMSHEIRTPMNAILGFSELLSMMDLTENEKNEYIGLIQDNSNMLLNLINDIIDISKIEAGQVDVSVTSVNIDEKMEDLLTFFKPEADKKGLQLSFREGLPDQVSVIETDQDKLFAILTNLVKNAIKFSHKGIIEFGYTSTGSESELEFFVIDTGIGIPKDKQKTIFDRFIQVDIEDENVYEGSGLGLPISKAYVELLGGKMSIESEEGKGSRFYFTIPCNNCTKEIPKN